jgi:DNA replication protein DnaC
VSLGPPGTGKMHLSIALGVQPPAAGTGWRSLPPKCVGRLGTAKRTGRLDEELEHLRRIPLVCVNEVE